jgi:excisionase family DNA binding protein
MEKRLMNIKELSEYLGTPKGSIYTMVCLRKIPPGCIIKLGRALRFEKAGIDKWITENRAYQVRV